MSGGVPEDSATFSTAVFGDFHGREDLCLFPGLSGWNKRGQDQFSRLRWRECCNLVYDLKGTLLEPPKYLFLALPETLSLEIQLFELRIGF